MTSRIIYTPRDERRPEKLFPLKRVFWVTATIFVLGAISASAIYVLRLPQWQIKEISLSGLEALSKEDIEPKIIGILAGEYGRLIPRSSIFLVSAEGIAQNLQTVFPRIEQIYVKKSFPNKLEVLVKERELFGIFCGQNSCAYMDASGFAYESAPSFSGSLIIKIKSDVPEVIIGQNVVESALMERMIFLGGEIRRSLGADAVAYELSSRTSREIRVETDEGFKIFFNRDDDFQNVFRVLKTVLDEEIKEKRARLEYIDVRFGNKAFYKLR